jgi:hypothetical protein
VILGFWFRILGLGMHLVKGFETSCNVSSI